jgi:hypothetical protein
LVVAVAQLRHQAIDQQPAARREDFADLDRLSITVSKDR